MWTTTTTFGDYPFTYTIKKLLVILLVSLGLQTQAQVNWCDSISYSTSQSFPLTIVGNSSLPPNWVDSIQWTWQVCNSTTCFSGYGQTAIFHNVLSTDTIKVCYDAYVYSPFTNAFTCTECDSLVYDFMTDTWVLFSMSNTTSTMEITFTSTDNFDSRMYDVLGREFQSFNSIPVGTIYIQNRKKRLKIANDGFRTLK